VASDVAIQAISFHGDGSFDISYAEQRDITPNVVMLRQVMVSPGVVDKEADDTRETIKELLDAALGMMHEAPSRISLK
jgi:hypothetical protein